MEGPRDTRPASREDWDTRVGERRGNKPKEGVAGSVERVEWTRSEGVQRANPRVRGQIC